MERQDLVLDFTHSYSADWLAAHEELLVLDCADIGGTDMYCTPEAEEKLQALLGKYPLKGVHFVDSGNYHYMTRLFTKQIKEPYQLVFLDNHNDMQPTLIPDLLSCGAWAKQSLEEDEMLQKLVIIGPTQATFHDIPIQDLPQDKVEKLVLISWEELEAQNLTKWEPDVNLPLYLSVDKDVLSEEYARTNWDQGQMTLPRLTELLSRICEGKKILGVDICGELPDAPVYEMAEVQRVNESTNEVLYQLLKSIL